jgi:acyl-CoA synthetase (AMP-forming)/AMP-acid ligase II
VSRLAWTRGGFLHDVVARGAALHPEAPALLDGDRRFSFAELADRTARAAAVVESSSRPGARVAFVGENHWSWVDAYYGVPRAGRVLVFLNHRLAPLELESVLERSGATMLVGSRAELDRIDRSSTAVTRVLDLDDWEAAVGGASPAAGNALALPRADTEAAWIIYTSGTTGRSKGAVLTHRSILAAVRATDECRVIAPDDVYLLPFPLCHIAGYNVIHHHARGVPLVLMPRFEPAGFVDAVVRHRVTSASLAATMLHSLLGYLDEHPERLADLATLRLVAYGAAPMPTPLLQRGHAVLAIDFTQGYGMTELSGNAVFLDVEAHRRGLRGDDVLLRTAGRPAPGVEVMVVDDEDRALGPGEPGEIVVRAEQVMDRYWEEPEATATTLAGGWLHTGDVGRFDTDGFLSVVDRKKDVIVTGGENVSSLEVEQVLHAVAGVGEVAVVGVPDPRWGENVCAVVVPAPGARIDPDALVAAAREHLAGFKVPRHVVVAESLPKNATGKVVKADIRAWLAERPDLVGERR